MVLQKKSIARRVAVGTCALVLTLLLAACGSASNPGSTSNSGSSSQVTNGNTNRYTLTPTPTLRSSSQSTNGNVAMKLYNGSGFSIQYPQDWKESPSGSEVAFIDPTGSYSLTVGTSANSEGSVTADQLASGGVTGAKANLKNVETVSVPETTTVDGQVWTQRSISGTSTAQGQSATVQADVLATNHPEHTTATKGYIIAYVALKDKFTQAKTEYFTPMLNSFKFAAA